MGERRTVAWDGALPYLDVEAWWGPAGNLGVVIHRPNSSLPPVRLGRNGMFNLEKALGEIRRGELRP
jgi:hypothetical protein